MNKQDIKKKFISGMYSFMCREVAANSKGKYTGEDIFQLSDDGTIITCTLPEDYFSAFDIQPTKIEIKFTAKK